MDADNQDDVDNNGTIGVEDCVYRLQMLSGLWYKDADNDGYTDGTTQSARIKPSGYVDESTLVSMAKDCNDNNRSINPSAAEICNTVDDNCNGQTDEGEIGSLYYRDYDSDGFGDKNSTVRGCFQPIGYVTNNTDCNDIQGTVYPGAPEVCSDGIDQDCNGSDCKGLERFAGKYNGSFSGNSWGTWQLTVDDEGIVFGRAFDQKWSEWLAVTGTVSMNGELAFTTGFTSSGASFTGTANDATGAVTGSWNNPYTNEKGTITGSGQFIKPPGTYDPFKGLYWGTYYGGPEGNGSFYAGVDAFGNISIMLDEGELGNSTISANGSFSVTIQTDGGIVYTSGTVLSSGYVSGEWTIPQYGLSGSFSGSRLDP